MARSETIPTLTTELALDILNKTVERLQTPENEKKLTEAKENVGNEMFKVMQHVFPIVMQLQMDVIKEFGFPESREGIIQFAQMLRELEREEPEIARLHTLIKSHYLVPVVPVAMSTSNEPPLDEKTTSN